MFMKYVLIFSLFFLSCSSDKLIAPNSNCITKIRNNNIIVKELEYDRLNRCIAIKASNSAGIVSYDGGKISRMVISVNYGGNISFDEIYDFKFSGDNAVSIISKQFSQPTPVTTRTLGFKDNLVTQSTYYDRGFIISSTAPPVPITTTTKQVYTYDSANNLIKKETLVEGRLTRLVEYRNYDDKINPLYANAMDWTIMGEVWQLYLSHPALPICKNNPQIIKQTDYNYSGGVLDKTVIKTDSVFYKYSQNNLPIEISTSNRDYYPVQIEYKN